MVEQTGESNVEEARGNSETNPLESMLSAFNLDNHPDFDLQLKDDHTQNLRVGREKSSGANTVAVDNFDLFVSEFSQCNSLQKTDPTPNIVNHNLTDESSHDIQKVHLKDLANHLNQNILNEDSSEVNGNFMNNKTPMKGFGGDMGEHFMAANTVGMAGDGTMDRIPTPVHIPDFSDLEKHSVLPCLLPRGDKTHTPHRDYGCGDGGEIEKPCVLGFESSPGVYRTQFLEAGDSNHSLLTPKGGSSLRYSLLSPDRSPRGTHTRASTPDMASLLRTSFTASPDMTALLATSFASPDGPGNISAFLRSPDFLHGQDLFRTEDLCGPPPVRSSHGVKDPVLTSSLHHTRNYSHAPTYMENFPHLADSNDCFGDDSCDDSDDFAEKLAAVNQQIMSQTRAGHAHRYTDTRNNRCDMFYDSSSNSSTDLAMFTSPQYSRRVLSDVASEKTDEVCGDRWSSQTTALTDLKGLNFVPRKGETIRLSRNQQGYLQSSQVVNTRNTECGYGDTDSDDAGISTLPNILSKSRRRRKQRADRRAGVQSQVRPPAPPPEPEELGFTGSFVPRSRPVQIVHLPEYHASRRRRAQRHGAPALTPRTGMPTQSQSVCGDTQHNIIHRKRTSKNRSYKGQVNRPSSPTSFNNPDEELAFIRAYQKRKHRRRFNAHFRSYDSVIKKMLKREAETSSTYNQVLEEIQQLKQQKQQRKQGVSGSPLVVNGCVVRSVRDYVPTVNMEQSHHTNTHVTLHESDHETELTHGENRALQTKPAVSSHVSQVINSLKSAYTPAHLESLGMCREATVGDDIIGRAWDRAESNKRKISKYDVLTRKLHNNQYISKELSRLTQRGEGEYEDGTAGRRPAGGNPDEHEDNNRFNDDDYVSSFIRSFQNNPRRYKVYPSATKFKKKNTPAKGVGGYRVRRVRDAVRPVCVIMPRRRQQLLAADRVITVRDNTTADKDSQGQHTQAAPAEDELNSSFGDPIEMAAHITNVAHTMTQPDASELVPADATQSADDSQAPATEKQGPVPRGTTQKIGVHRYGYTVGKRKTLKSEVEEEHVGRLLAYINDLNGKVKKVAKKTGLVMSPEKKAPVPRKRVFPRCKPLDLSCKPKRRRVIKTKTPPAVTSPPVSHTIEVSPEVGAEEEVITSPGPPTRQRRQYTRKTPKSKRGTPADKSSGKTHQANTTEEKGEHKAVEQTDEAVESATVSEEVDKADTTQCTTSARKKPRVLGKRSGRPCTISSWQDGEIPDVCIPRGKGRPCTSDVYDTPQYRHTKACTDTESQKMTENMAKTSNITADSGQRGSKQKKRVKKKRNFNNCTANARMQRNLMKENSDVESQGRGKSCVNLTDSFDSVVTPGKCVGRRALGDRTNTPTRGVTANTGTPEKSVTARENRCDVTPNNQVMSVGAPLDLSVQKPRREDTPTASVLRKHYHKVLEVCAPTRRRSLEDEGEGDNDGHSDSDVDVCGHQSQSDNDDEVLSVLSSGVHGTKRTYVTTDSSGGVNVTLTHADV